MTFLQLLKQLFSTSPPVKPILRRSIDVYELSNVLAEKFPDTEIYLSDRTKYLCDIEDIKTFLAQDETNRTKYVAEAFDCDDFAYRLKGQFSVHGWAELATGIVWTNCHALNIVVDANLDVWIIEPQSDKIQSNLEEWQGDSIRFIII